MAAANQLSEFARDVHAGLSASPKTLPSRYFYDEVGDKIFQEIMALEEYYLTRSEYSIFESRKEQILASFSAAGPFRLIELGAGDGLKTKILLKHFLEVGVDFTYSPVDISGNVLEILESNLKSEIPGLKIESFQGDYFDALAKISENPEKDIVFFLGSNVGNFGGDDAVGFLQKLQKFLKKDDLLFMGVDLKKDPSAILSAYNDKDGVTRAFNLNLLDRINTELDANFNKDQFLHYPYYNPQTGECRSYLISKVDQVVTIDDEEIHFDAWEAIFMEISKKYDRRQLQKLADQAGFTPVESFYDSEKWFADVLWKK